MARNTALAEAFNTTEMFEGAGARVKRAFPTPSLQTTLNPFVLLDEFSLDGSGGFPDHPHRGQEIVTYMLEGAFRHTDDLGNDRAINAGGLQRITAGKGIVHSEMPAAEGMNHGLQLWIALPKAERDVEPSYQELRPDRVLVQESEGKTVRVLIGEGSPVTLRTEVEYLDVTLQPGVKHTQSIPPGFEGFAYPLSGGGRFSGEEASSSSGRFVALRDPAELVIEADKGDSPLRFVLVVGKPHRESISLNGPFVG